MEVPWQNEEEHLPLKNLANEDKKKNKEEEGKEEEAGKKSNNGNLMRQNATRKKASFERDKKKNYINFIDNHSFIIRCENLEKGGQKIRVGKVRKVPTIDKTWLDSPDIGKKYDCETHQHRNPGYKP